MSAPTSLDLMRQPGATMALVRRAAKLWPDSDFNQRAWIKAVVMVRGTARGWQLDKHLKHAASHA